jgi:hypothetical protein
MSGIVRQTLAALAYQPIELRRDPVDMAAQAVEQARAVR